MLFSECSSYQKLAQQAKHPLDLTEDKNLTPERIRDFCTEGCGFKLLFGTERISQEVLELLFDLAEERKAVAQMEKMQKGFVLNKIEGYPSEHRSVLHTAMRDFFEDQQDAELAKVAREKALLQIESLKAFLPQMEPFAHLVVIGIGGSALGPEALYLALENLQKKGKSVHFISNVDPDHAARVMQKIDPKKTLVLVISKSGATLETFANEELVRGYFKKNGCEPKEYFVAVTGEGSPMDSTERYLKSFHMWDYVGGRFSASSLCGGILLSFAFGFPVYWELLRGAHAMDKNALKKNPRENLPLLASLFAIWNRNFLKLPTEAIIPYSQALSRWAAHIQQVAMESNGKQIDREGRTLAFETCPVIYGEPGTNAQHSFFQMIHQGTTPVPLEFIAFKESQYQFDAEVKGTTSQEKLLANLFAQSLALAQGKKSENPNKAFPGNRPSHILLGEKLTPYALGALLSFYEHKVAFQGFIWDINSFDQEGVQLGKVVADKILKQFVGRRAKNPKDTEGFVLGWEMLKHL